jgi:hypothetical protein
LLLQVAYKVPWTAISSLLGQFSVRFNQPAILLWLNLAYFLPSVPALLLHSSLQERLEQWLGLPRAAMARWAGTHAASSSSRCIRECNEELSKDGTHHSSSHRQHKCNIQL